MKWFIVWICLGPMPCLGPGVGVSQNEFSSQDECKIAIVTEIRPGYTTFCAVYANGDPA